MHFQWIFIKEQGQIIFDILKQLQKKSDFTYYGTISILMAQSYELNKIINKDVLWFFIKLDLQKITKTHDNVCCALTPRYNLLQEKQ